MRFSVFNEFHEDSDSVSSGYGVQMLGSKFGIVYVGKLPPESLRDVSAITPPPLKWVIMPEYDNIFRCGINEFVLCKRGKVGAVRFVDDMPDTPKQIAPCEYDTMDTNHDVFIFFKPGEQLYYSCRSHRVQAFNHTSFLGPESRYLFAADASVYYILDCFTDMVLWSCEKDANKLCPWGFFATKPCLVYMGEKDGLPMFFDCANSNYLFPCGEDKLDLVPNFPNVITPIIVQGENIVNITDDSEKVRAGSCDECVQESFSESKGFDKVTVEIKITLKSQDDTQVRCYPLPKGTFVPGDVVDLGEWYI